MLISPKISSYLINPVERRRAALEKPDTLDQKFAVPDAIPSVPNFLDMDESGLADMIQKLGLAMDLADLSFLQSYFKKEGRNPTLTEIRVADTYWSDHCRHTTFSTHLDSVKIQDPRVQKAYDEYLQAREEVYEERVSGRPITLMDIATAGVKLLKKRGLLPLLDESEEINACSVKTTITVDGKEENWL